MHKMFNALKGKGAALAAVGTAALVSAPAFASGGGGVDVGPVVTAINAALGPIGQIGAAVLTVLVGVKVYKWVRRAITATGAGPTPSPVFQRPGQGRGLEWKGGSGSAHGWWPARSFSWISTDVCVPFPHCIATCDPLCTSVLCAVRACCQG